MVNGSAYEEISEGGSDGGCLKNSGGEKKTASVLDALVSLPTCIWSPNLLN